MSEKVTTREAIASKKLDELAVSAGANHPGFLFTHRVRHGLCFEEKEKKKEKREETFIDYETAGATEGF